MAKNPNVNAANKYARDVVSGRVIACKYVQQACQRHLNDLEKSKEKDYPYRFDAARAERACKFLQLLPHTKGKWRRLPLDKRRITLEPWQLFFHACVYGWVRKKDGLRRFRRAALFVPRKNGKSIVAAGNGIYMFAADDEPGAEVYCGATTEKQAWEVFKPAMQIAAQLPNLRRKFGIQVCAKKMLRQDGSVFEPVIGNPGDGSSPHLAIVDEYHEHDSPELYDTMETGQGAREQPMMLVISTAGVNPAGPCKQFWDECVKMLSGAEPDEELFALIYTIDDDDDIFDPASLRKANPNYGISVFEDYLLAQLMRAKRNARHLTKYLIKHLNKWTTASSTFFNYDHWRSAADATLKIEDFIGCPCWFALDLASKLDVCSLAICFARYEADGLLHYYLFTRHWLPEDTTNDPDNRNAAKYQEWISTVWPNAGGMALTPTDGAEIDFGEIGAEVATLASTYAPREIPHDPWNSAQLAQQLATAGWLPVAIPQTTAHLSPPMKEMESALAAGRLHHDDNPVMNWMVGNVTAREDANENVFPRKEGKDNKIDGAMAAIMAIGRAMLNKGAFSSPYSEDDYDPTDAVLD
ncbi:terminase large subunit [Aeromonas caviae]|jgi:phage terminase large subunit-like protein|uniref:terminase large subunit n=1 Tax=Aeromonas caviae TaxID=648 RepID=UPI002B476333|nr:terminase TerL endonuclease subunit [Aeromonas caviae]